MKSSKRNRHTGRVNAAKQRILDATVNLDNTDNMLQEYVTRVIGDKTYKGIQTKIYKEGYCIRDTVTLVKA